jgi:dTDP-4-dehydrorhamnose reductase
MTASNELEARGARRQIGVLGAGGQLGRCLVRGIEASSDCALAFALTRNEVDLSNPDTLPDAITKQLDLRLSSEDSSSRSSAVGGLDVVINAAAYTKVDACESEPSLAYQTNALAPAEWARQLAARGIHFIHVSTDYVFAGDGARPYREDDPTDPRTVYGASKRAGEVAVLGTSAEALVVRTSWVFGPGRNFVAAILDQAIKRRTGELSGPLKVVEDQQGSPTSAEDLAEALLVLACRQERESGLLHLRNSGVTTWYGFARGVLDRAGFEEIAIDPVPTSAFQTAAPRPAYSVLDCRRAEALGISMPTWTDALDRYLAGPDCPDVLAQFRTRPDRSGRNEVSR